MPECAAMRFKLLLIYAMCFGVAACGEVLSPPTPPLLKAATSTGGAIFSCEDFQMFRVTPESASHSPEIDQRLRQSFPAGTPALDLRRSLVRQGFALQGACVADRSIQWAKFRQQGGNGITVFPAFSTVYWKEDDAGNIEWATGDIHFTGL
ncbi:hypothetical protein D3C73_1208300 [compost metagenome]